MPAPKDPMKKIAFYAHLSNLYKGKKQSESDIKHNTQESTMRILNMIKNKEVENRMWFG